MANSKLGMGSRRMGNGREHGPRDRIDTGFLRRRIHALEVAFKEVKLYDESDILHGLFQAASV